MTENTAQSPLSQFNEAIFKYPLIVSHVKLHFFINSSGTLKTGDLSGVDTLGRFYATFYKWGNISTSRLLFRTPSPL